VARLHLSCWSMGRWFTMSSRSPSY
jgi:hypothetical protein